MRGKNRGLQCKEPSVPGTKYCEDCSMKKRNNFPTLQTPPMVPGRFMYPHIPPMPFPNILPPVEPRKLKVIPIDVNKYITAYEPYFILENVHGEGFRLLGAVDDINMESDLRELTEEEKEIALGYGLNVH